MSPEPGRKRQAVRPRPPCLWTRSVKRRFVSFFLFALLWALPTAARAGEKAVTRIAFGSCNHQDRPQTIWEPLLRTNPELFLFLGDNVYADTFDMDELRKTYAQLGDTPG